MPGREVWFISETATGPAADAATAFDAAAKSWGLPHRTFVRTPAEVTTLPADAAQLWVTIGTSGTAIPTSAQEAAYKVVAWDVSRPSSEQISDLIALLLGGSTGGTEKKSPPPATIPAKPPKSRGTVKLSRETAGRRGKGVTVVSELPLTLAAIEELGATLKTKCGTGGTVKDARIEIQGDHRDRVQAELEKLGYKVKRSGG